MNSLLVVILLFIVFYLISKWYKNHNKCIIDNYVKCKDNDYIFVEEDNSKAIGINESSKIINLYYVNDNDSIDEKSFDIDRIINVELSDDSDSDQKCKFVRLNIYTDEKSDYSLFQIIFLAPSWTLEGHDGYQKNSEKYLRARQQANKFLNIINSLKGLANK